jgi:hypothetical protein
MSPQSWTTWVLKTRCSSGCLGQSYKEDEPVESTVPGGHHTCAELLRLVGAVRRLAFDRNLPPSEALGRIRDAFHGYDHSSQS